MFFAIDFLFGLLFDQIIKRSPDGRYFKAHYSLNYAEQDIIIFGNSRAETNFAPFVFEEELGMTAWNTGRGGQGLAFWYAMQRGVLERHEPQLAIVNIEAAFLTDRLGRTFERAGFLRPFYRAHPEIRPVINQISWAERFLLTSRLYAFNSSFYYLLRPFLIKGLDGLNEDLGWKPRTGVINIPHNNVRVIDNIHQDLNPEVMVVFHSFLNNFLERNIPVLFVISPDYAVNIQNTATIKYLEDLPDSYFVNYGNNEEFFLNHKLFNDREHLNKKGAILFSKELTNDIVSVLAGEKNRLVLEITQNITPNTIPTNKLLGLIINNDTISFKYQSNSIRE